MKEIKEKELPAGWDCRNVDEILVIEDGDRGENYPQKKDFLNSGPCLFLSTKNIRSNGFLFEENQFISKEKDGILRKGKLKRGDIVFTSRGTIGNIAYYDLSVPFDSLRINSGMFIIRGFQEYLTEKYLEYYLRSPFITKQIAGLKSGTAQPQLPIRDFKKFILLFPQNINQQKAIVAKIEELFSHIDAGVEALKKSKALLKQYRQSVLKAAVTGELTKEWRTAQGPALEPGDKLLEQILVERRRKWEEQQMAQFKAKGKVPKDDSWKEKYEEPVGPDTEGLPELPAEWCWVKLGAVIEEPKYGTSKKCSYKKQGVGVLRIPNIAGGIIDSSDLKYAEFDNDEYEAYKLFEGDILIIRSNGSINLVGKCALIQLKDIEFLYAGYLIRLRPYDQILNGSFLIYAMNTNFLRYQIESKAKSTSGVNNINSGELQSLVIPICLLEEQKEIVRIVDEKLTSITRLEKEIETKLGQVEKMRQSILAAAFSGRLV